MAYDDMLYRATITSGGSVVLDQIKGPSTIRSGYGAARLVGVRALYHSTDAADDNVQIKVEYKNTNWTRSNKLYAAVFGAETSQARNTYNYVSGHGFSLLSNSAFIVSATTASTIAGTCTVDVIITVDYDAVPSINPDNYAGCPITFSMTQGTAVSGNAGSQVRLGSYDVLDPGITYALNEVSTTNASLGMAYLVLEGIQTQRGLSRVFPLPVNKTGIVPTILGSVTIVKQSFDLSIISDVAITSQTIPIDMEMLASSNSIGGA